MSEITRKGFLGAVAAAIAAPAVAGAKVARHRDVITQAELQAIIDADIALDRRCWSLRHRLDAGAVVQPGALDIDVEEGEFEEAGYANAKGAAFCGISIDPAAEVAESRAHRAEWDRRREAVHA